MEKNNLEIIKKDCQQRLLINNLNSEQKNSIN